ncbi:MAG: ADP-forming succinate--CoA ligase subunit beta, partial [Rhodocyclaceae bacterium]|nr:ADP-forming succinate--CoA ligase subunit beta [Rhodocyclaceae bacterium]
EYQSKQILDKHGVKTQPWALATSAAEAESAAKELAGKHGTKQFVVKAQIHAGGRGVGTFTNGFKGGVHLVDTPEKVRQMAENMLGQRLVTKQTPPEGVLVNKLMIAHAIDFNIEYYLSFVMDREAGGPCLVFSPDGGMDIENVAHDFPELIMKVPIPIETGMTQELARQLAYRMGFTDWHEGAEQLRRLYDLFIKCDCSQLEINPWAQTPTADIYAIDAKLNFDESAKFRQQDIFDLRDPTEEDPREVAASKVGLNYIGMDGTIGCMVNGAGLAMATMDEIKLCGGSPANFLDVGGGATEEQVANAFRIITSDPKVDALLINIFGGIMRCDVIANGIVNAAKTVDLKVPMVVRLAGTNY